MALQLQNFQSLMSDEIGDDGNDTNNTYYLNMAARDIWRYAAWPEVLTSAFVNTVAPVTTGTVTLANGDATVEGAGGMDWTSPSVAGYKFALGYGKPWYTVDTVTDADTLELAQAYAGSAASAVTYVLYNDIVTLASDVETVRRVWLHDSDRAYRMSIVPETQIEHVGHYPRQSERPYFAAVIANSSGGSRRLRLGPFAPDAVYRIEYEYSKAYTDMSSSTDTTGLNAALDDAVLELALSMAYRRDHFRRSQSMRQSAMRLVQEEWRRNRPANSVVHLSERQDIITARDVPYDIGDLEIS